LVRGASNSAGEIGHIKLQMHGGPICGCGDTGCLEAFASAPAIVAMAEDYIKGGKSTKFRELANPDITSYVVSEAAKQGDAVANRIFSIIGEYIGIGLASVVNLLNPEKIIIGGGVAAAGDILFDPIKATINSRAMAISANAVEVVPAKLGNTAGVIGASLLINS
jgi:glucokinase